MKVIVICGSPRQNSLTRVLTGLAHRYAKELYPDAAVEHLMVRVDR